MGSAEFFQQLTPGDCFRWESSYKVGQNGQYKTHRHWIYAQFVGAREGTDARVRVTWAYWDQRDGYLEEWKPSAAILFGHRDHQASIRADQVGPSCLA